MILIYLIISMISANESDPNNYFKNKSWSLSWNEHSIEAKSTYVEEPVSFPNRLSIDLICKGKTEKISVTSDFKYCGLDSISIVGDNVALYLTDFNPNDNRGYCTIKKQKNIPIPNGCEIISKTKEKKKK